MTRNKDRYPFHAPVQTDANYAYCMRARSVLGRLAAKRQPRGFLARLRALFGRG